MLVVVRILTIILAAAVSVEWNEESSDQVLWKKDCDFDTGNIIVEYKVGTVE